METLILSIVLPVSREKLYHAWLDSDEHTKFTASSAVIDPRVGGEFYAWNGYITGKKTSNWSHRAASCKAGAQPILRMKRRTAFWKLCLNRFQTEHD